MRSSQRPWSSGAGRNGSEEENQAGRAELSSECSQQLEGGKGIICCWCGVHDPPPFVHAVNETVGEPCLPCFDGPIHRFGSSLPHRPRTPSPPP